MKTKLGLLIVTAFIGSTVRVQSDETLHLGGDGLSRCTITPRDKRAELTAFEAKVWPGGNRYLAATASSLTELLGLRCGSLITVVGN
jgi:hypothetical protein